MPRIACLGSGQTTTGAFGLTYSTLSRPMVGGSYAVSVDPSCKKITSEGEITLSFKSQFLGRQCYNGEWRHFIPKSCPIKSEDCGGTEYTVAATPSWPIPSNSAAVIHIDGVPGGGLCLQFLDAHFKNKNIGPISRVQRVGTQAIIGTLSTVATSVAEAEAYLATV